jgi:hypothetical protein
LLRYGNAQVIIRPVCTKNFSVIPNAVLNDKRLSIDTRGMVAYLLSKPPSWAIRPWFLARALLRDGENPVGRKRIARMFSEATEAGYMARSQEQKHCDDGSWGAYDYIIGMPAEVKAAVVKSGVAFSPRRPETLAPQARAPEERQNHKEQNREKTEFKKPPSKVSPTGRSDTAKAEQDEYSEMGRSALAAGMTPVFLNSKAYDRWLKFRGSDGMPLTDAAVINGQRRRIMWFPQLYPPDYHRSGSE